MSIVVQNRSTLASLDLSSLMLDNMWVNTELIMISMLDRTMLDIAARTVLGTNLSMKATSCENKEFSFKEKLDLNHFQKLIESYSNNCISP